VLGAYFYGNIATQIIGGILAEKIGGKWVFGFGGFVAAVATLLSPVAARAGMGWFIAIRTIIGIGQVLKYTMNDITSIILTLQRAWLRLLISVDVTGQIIHFIICIPKIDKKEKKIIVCILRI
jgi:MFS family permease